MKSQEKLARQMEKIYVYHNQIRQLIIDDSKNFSHHQLMKKIDHWEQESILKIHQTAHHIREELKHVYTKHTLEISNLFTKISQQLNQARIENNYIENDIKYWLEKLNELKRDFQTPKTINIYYENDQKQSFINKIKLSKISIDSFHEIIGDLQIINNGYTILHGPSYGDATLRGKKEYSSGIHQFHFLIEKLGIPKWIFFGIISKDTPLQANLYKTPSVYGWAGHHQVWLNGNHHHQYDGYKSDMNINNIIELIIDCDRQKICLTNQSTLITYEIEVSLLKCPFPWILYLGLYGANDQIRLLLA